MINKKFSIILYFLSAILVLVLSVFIYRIATHIYYVNSHVRLGVLQSAGKYTTNTNSSAQSKLATFSNTSNITPIVDLNSANMVFEFMTKSNRITYKSVFSNEATKNIKPTTTFKIII